MYGLGIGEAIAFYYQGEVVFGCILGTEDRDDEYYIKFIRPDGTPAEKYLHADYILGRASKYRNVQKKPCGLTKFLEKHV